MSLTIIFGLASGLIWGAGDFLGGLATKRLAVLVVVIGSQLVGGLFLLPIALILGEPLPAAATLLLGALGGLAGALGLLAFYTGLARGQMGVVAPVAAVVTGLLPIGLSFALEGLPAPLQLSGFALALVAVWLLARGDSHVPPRWADLRLAFAAGMGFGLFFVFIDQVSETAIFWPLVAARAGSVALFSLIAWRRRPVSTPLDRRLLLTIAAAGIFDTSGNAFFALAARAGRLDIAAVLASLYPVTTALLAWLVLKERLVLTQWLGVLTALAALVLIAL